MKNILPIILFCMLSCFANAQKVVEKRMNYAAGKVIDMNIQIADSIRIITWNKNEVYAKASIEINKNKDNDIYLVNFDESGSSLDIRAKFDDVKREQTYDDSCRCWCNNFRSKI